MNFKKYLIICSLFLILCISLSVVSATDNMDINDVNQDDSVVSTITVDGNNSDNSGNSAISNLKEYEKTFTDLNNTISDATDYLVLEEDYTFNNNTDNSFIDGIIIDKTMTIDGQGHTISGSNLARVFQVISVNNVTIKNIKFINTYSRNEEGTAIWSGGLYGCVSNCSFINCTSEKRGGAICWAYGDYGCVSDCSFVNCNSNGDGGAICWWGKGSVNGCTFTNCKSGYYGGAICWVDDEGNVSDCTFTNCSASVDGGAIYWYADDGCVSDCSFVNCNSNGDGGAIYWTSSNSGGRYGSVINCSFTDCSAKSNGGAIFWDGANDGSVTNCNFINTNALTNDGGAIYWYDGNNGIVSNCNFINTLAINGGAISMSGENGSVTNCTFTNTTARGGEYCEGGAISMSGENGSVTNCTFINTTADTLGGAISWYGDEGTKKVNVSYCVFDNNNAPIGKIISIDKSYDLSLVNNFYGTNNITNNEFKDLKLISKVYFSMSAGDYVLVENLFDSNPIVLNISVSDSKYVLNFVKRNGGIIIGMPEYDVNAALSDGSSSVVTVGEEQELSNETMDINIYSLNSGTLLNSKINYRIVNITSVTNVTYGNNVTVVVNITNGTVNGTLKVYNGTKELYSINTMDSGNNLSFNLSVGVYNNLYIIYDNFGGGSFNSTNTLGSVSSLTVSPANATVSVGVSDICYGEGPGFRVVITGLDGVVLDNSSVTFAVFDEDGVDVTGLSILAAGEYTVVAYFPGNENYTNASASKVFVVNKADSCVNIIVPETVYYGEIVTITVNVPEDATGNVTLTINGKTYINSVKNSVVTFNISNLSARIYDVLVFYTGDINYNNALNTTILEVNKITPFIIVDVDDICYGMVPGFSAVVTGLDGVVLDNSSVTFAVFDEDGVDVTGLSILAAGEYTVVASYPGNENYTNNNSSKGFTVNKKSVTLTPSALSTTYNSGKVFQVKVVDNNQNPITGLKLTLKVYTGSSYQTVTVNTGSDGIAKYSASKLSIGTHNVVVSLSHTNYVADSKTSSIKISKATVTITPTALNTTYDSGKYFQVKVLDANKKAVNGLKLTLKIYTGSKVTSTVYVTTDASGIAKYSASKLSIGTHKVIVSLSNTYYTASSKTSSIKVSKAPTTVTAPVVKYKKGANKYFKVTVKNKATGKVVKSLAIKIKVYTGKKYKTYTVKTNTKGIAQLSTKALAKGTHKVVISSGNSKYTVSKSGNLIVIK